MLVTDLIHKENHQHNEKSHQHNDVTNITVTYFFVLFCQKKKRKFRILGSFMMHKILFKVLMFFIEHLEINFWQRPADIFEIQKCFSELKFNF